MGAVSMTTGGRKDHWFLIMLGGVGPDSVGRPPTMSSANLRNSCMIRHSFRVVVHVGAQDLVTTCLVDT